MCTHQEVCAVTFAQNPSDLWSGCQTYILPVKQRSILKYSLISHVMQFQSQILCPGRINWPEEADVLTV
jgi:hypothetical protein